MFRLLQPQIGSQGGRVPLAGQGRSPCRRQAKPPHEVRILRAEHGYSARRRAVKRPKSAKGVWGKTRVFPHKQHIKSSRDYPPKQSGGLFRKHTTQLNYSLINCRFTETHTQKQQWADLLSAHNFQLIATPRKKFFV